ncbi:MAG: ribonuclease P protein component [Rubrivivax sp.]|nr:ribonuclease P protein component [Rubrivivax sp.]
MVGRLVHKADFERVLATPSRTRSAHFALHHLANGPLSRKRLAPEALSSELSTGPAPACPQTVDDLPAKVWLGCVVPKRHARRAVTRNLLKRQMRGAFHRHAAALAGGLWLLRLRAPFPATEFVSARSAALAAAAHDELDRLLARAAA